MGKSTRRTALAALWSALFIFPVVAVSQNTDPTIRFFCQDALLQPTLDLFSSEWSAEKRKRFIFERFQQAGITLDNYSLVKNTLNHAELKHLIAPDFAVVRGRIRSALKSGKVVLLLNGSFDLVHEGHAGMVQASLHNFLQTQNLNRDQVYLVILADSDSLIFNSKKHKWKTFGGSEDLPRPLQSLKNIPNSSPTLHPRAVDLANLGADLVGITPSPAEFLELSHQLWFQHFLFSTHEADWFRGTQAVLEQESFTSEQVAEIDTVIETAIRMLNAFRSGRAVDIIKDFEKAGPREVLPLWHVSSWQMVLQYSLGLDEFHAGTVHQVLNLRDAEYLHNVSTWSKANGRTIHFIDGTEVLTSTTELLKAYPMKALVERKSGHYPLTPQWYADTSGDQ